MARGVLLLRLLQSGERRVARIRQVRAMSVELGLIVLRLPPGAFFSRMSAMNFVVGFGTVGLLMREWSDEGCC